MATFRHHPDALIFLGDMQIPLAFFQQQESGYALPKGAIGREYIPGSRHTLSDGSSQWGGDLPWLEGDHYLAKLETYRAAWTAANASAPVTAPADWDTFRTAMMGDAAYQKMAIGVMGTTQGNWLLTTLQDAITMPAPALVLVQPLWNQIIQLTPLKPTDADVDRWQGYAASSAVGITFSTTGAIA